MEWEKKIGRASIGMPQEDKHVLACLVANLELLADGDTVLPDLSSDAEPTPEADE